MDSNNNNKRKEKTQTREEVELVEGSKMVICNLFWTINALKCSKKIILYKINLEIKLAWR